MKTVQKYKKLFEGAFFFDWDEYLRWWATPSLLVKGYLGQRLVSAYFVVKADAMLDQKALTVAGLGGLATHSAFQRRGLASYLISHTWPTVVNLFRADIGLLICNDSNKAFYEKLGWQLYKGHIAYEKTQRSESFEFNVMCHALASSADHELCVNSRLW